MIEIHEQDAYCLMFIVGVLENKTKNKNCFKALYFKRATDQLPSNSTN